MASIDGLAGDMKFDVDWDLSELAGDLDLGGPTSIHDDYGLLLEVCSAVKESIPSPVADLLSWMIRVVEVMSTASILGARVCSLESTLFSNVTRIE